MIYLDKDRLKEIGQNNMTYFIRIFLVFICVISLVVVFLSVHSPKVNKTTGIQELAKDHLDRGSYSARETLVENNVTLNLPTTNDVNNSASILNFDPDRKPENENQTVHLS